MPISVRHPVHLASTPAAAMNGQRHFIILELIRFAPFWITVNRYQLVRFRQKLVSSWSLKILKMSQISIPFDARCLSMQNNAKMWMEIRRTILDREHFCGSAHHRMQRWRRNRPLFNDRAVYRTTLKRPSKCAYARNHSAWPTTPWTPMTHRRLQKMPQTQWHLRRTRMQQPHPIQWCPFGRPKRLEPVYCQRFFSNLRHSQPMPKKLNNHRIVTSQKEHNEGTNDGDMPLNILQYFSFYTPLQQHTQTHTFMI